MISFVFLWIKAKSFTDPYYIEHIVTSISQHTSYTCDFVCITDQVKKYTEWSIKGHKVRAFPLIKKFNKHQHNKLEFFRRDLNLCKRAVATDLDNFIIGDLDELLSYNGTFGARRTFLPHKRPQPQMSWAQFDSEDCYFIWDRANEFNDKGINRFAPTGGGQGDQLFIYKVYGEYDRLDDLFPGQLESWKRGWDDRTRVLFAHGKQKPSVLDWTPYWPWESLSTEVKNKRRQGITEQNLGSRPDS